MTTPTATDLMRIEKLTAMLATGNNGCLRLDCLSPTALRLFNKHKAQMEALGVAVFTNTRVYTPAGFAFAKALSDEVHAQNAAAAKAAREANQQRDLMNQKGDRALDALLARAENMTMSA